MLDIHTLMRGLAEKRPVFHNEADFQFALASHIREECRQPVRLEWKPFPMAGDVPKGEFQRLGAHLTSLRAKRWLTTFANLACVLGDLPDEARDDPNWWGNCCHQPQSRSWLAAGWQVAKVDVVEETVLFRHSRIYVDLWLPRLGMAIELKYRTRGLECLERSSDLDPPCERFSLADQNAQDHGRYDFLRDMTRLEWVVADRPDAGRGMAVLLTNDPLYWCPPDPKKPETFDASFRLHEPPKGKPRCLPKTMEWAKGVGGAKKGKECPIVLGDSYTLDWQDYPLVEKPENAKYRAFRYLAVEVPSVSAGATEGESPTNRPGGSPSS